MGTTSIRSKNSPSACKLRHAARRPGSLAMANIKRRSTRLDAARRNARDRTISPAEVLRSELSEACEHSWKAHGRLQGVDGRRESGGAIGRMLEGDRWRSQADHTGRKSRSRHPQDMSRLRGTSVRRRHHGTSGRGSIVDRLIARLRRKRHRRDRRGRSVKPSAAEPFSGIDRTGPLPTTAYSSVAARRGRGGLARASATSCACSGRASCWSRRSAWADGARQWSWPRPPWWC